MQSHLEAALLGHNAHDEDENHFQEEEADDTEEFDEENEHESFKIQNKIIFSSKEATNRTVTLQNLLSAGILESGSGAMTIEYLGQKFVGDLLEDGRIKSQETDVIFASPSAWAIACKRFINPDKKSGCGWASVKYKGKKLDAYKNIWYKKKKEEDEKFEREMKIESAYNIKERKNVTSTALYQRIVVKHNTIINRNLTHDANTMIECVPFSNLGKIQPFLVSLSTNAALLMDFHCHLMKSEVSGYLAGYWDVNSHNLQISHAFPCLCAKNDREAAVQIENEISKKIERNKLFLIGWYHSHPYTAAAPTLRDVDAQLDYQIKMKGINDNTYIPCIAIIISPYNYENTSLESSIMAYWVIPPPETKPNEYGRPMLMSYSVIQDPMLSPLIKDEMIKCVQYYKQENGFVNFNERYLSSTCYIDKLKTTLISKFPREESETDLWKFIRELLGISKEEKETLLSIPNVTKTGQLLSNMSPVSLNSNLMLSTEISSLLFNSGKYSTATSLLGLPDPMAHSTLAANNMFLQTNFFKMQELLKPLSTSSPIQHSKVKVESKSQGASPNLKVPTDLKNLKLSNLQTGSSGMKNKLEFSTSDLNWSKMSKDFSVNDYILSLSKSQTNTQEYSVSDLNLSDYNLNLSKTSEKAAKIPKLDYSENTLDLSVSKSSSTEITADVPTDLSVANEKISSNVENAEGGY